MTEGRISASFELGFAPANRQAVPSHWTLKKLETRLAF
jgi:hypothetical protein